MSQIVERPLPLREAAAQRSQFLEDVLRGLGQAQKRIDCKYFYDKRGSELFDQICDLREYYPTRTEISIMRRHGREMAAVVGARCLVVEYGSGSSLKTRLLLDRLQDPAGYIPIDISREHLMEAGRRIQARYPALHVIPLCADYTASLQLPKVGARSGRTVAYFPGSTIGNFEPEQAIRFLRRVREACGAASGLLIGVDLKKSPATLHSAYNDASGVTAKFNLNLLVRMNRELGTDFDLSNFEHRAFYNACLGRIEMHLISRRDQVIQIAGRSVAFRRGESVLTEYSYKYAIDEFARVAARAGYLAEQVWIDRRRLFSVHYLSGCGD